MVMNVTASRAVLVRAMADGHFHSGSDLARLIGVSRAAIHNHIKALSDLGIEIFRVRGKGYRLAAPLSLYDAERLTPRAAPIHLHWQIGSTNDVLLQRRMECKNGEVCIAEWQTAGRGRRGRSWFSPLASQLCFSYFYRLEQGMAAASGLSLVIGIILAEALERCQFTGIQVKWPNDLYYQQRKLGGILIEVQGQMGEPAELVIGCGINVSLPYLNEIDQPWADLQEQSTQLIDRNTLLSIILSALDAGLEQFRRFGFEPFESRWQQRDAFAHQPIRLVMGERCIDGIARGIDRQGNLLIEREGMVKAFAAGEVSLRLRKDNMAED
ncbi:MAG: bifunctional biotin--[acetyl-CoA-carboxylase] ligase/biotin operon repressor BirA [Ferrimonas sp.]